MIQPSTSAEVLAHWRYTAEEWSRFGRYEGRHWLRVIKQSKTVFLVFLALTILALLAVPLFGIFGIAPWDQFMLGAVFLILIVGGGLMTICVMVWLVQRSKLSALTASNGDVIVTLTGICTSGSWHNWNYGDLRYNRFHDARRMTIAKGKPGQMELLEVRTIATTVTGGTGTGVRDVISSCRVPIPAGMERQAEEFVRDFYAQLESKASH